MKRLYSLYLISIFILFSCGQKSKTSDKDKIALSAEKSKEQVKSDSLALAEQDKAIGDIRFFISEKQFEKEKNAFLKKNEVPENEMFKDGSIGRYKIGEYGFNFLDGWFHSDSLYEVRLEGGLIEYSKYDLQMRQQYLILLELLSTKYGTPQTFNGFPNWTSIDDGYFKRCATWEIGTKIIEMRISGHKTDYSLDLVAYKPEIELKIAREKELQFKKEQKRGVDAL